ncbi:hypothetical protein RJ640_010862 [Escallonia rubra]|uniref:Uncharacterized protein n=1 Tax=Escallonia rubra TaxID=112253 RepID=A0AA88RKA0_9ASTE|nr:hypothetical protein RJ640_010862 [Escallonia rubra]
MATPVSAMLLDCSPGPFMLLLIDLTLCVPIVHSLRHKWSAIWFDRLPHWTAMPDFMHVPHKAQESLRTCRVAGTRLADSLLLRVVRPLSRISGASTQRHGPFYRIYGQRSEESAAATRCYDASNEPTNDGLMYHYGI